MPATPRKKPRKENEVTPPSSPAVTSIKKFSVSSRGWPKLPTISQVFVSFFLDQVLAGYMREKKEWAAADSPVKEKRSIKNKLLRTKNLVRLMLYFADHYPRERPNTGNVKELQDWTTEVQLLAARITEDIKGQLGPKRMSPTQARDSKEAKQWELERKLPPDTPEWILEFLKIDEKISAPKKRKAKEVENTSGTVDNVTNVESTTEEIQPATTTGETAQV